MIRLHMLNYQIIRFPTAKNRFQIVKPLMRKGGIYGIHNGCFYVRDDIRIIGYTIRHCILTFKKIDSMVVYSDLVNIFGYHTCFLRYVFHDLFRQADTGICGAGRIG